MSVRYDNYSAAIWKNGDYFYGSLHDLKDVCECSINRYMFRSINRDVTAGQLQVTRLFMTARSAAAFKCR
jgi:hypothetical protein